jgi:hypothetical protein
VASGSSTVATAANLSVGAGHLLLASVATKAYTAVVSVSGLGLTWQRIATQCSGRNQTGIEMWAAKASGSATGPVSATLAAVATNSVIAVASYAGVAAVQPLGDPITANSNGIAGACGGGIDSSAYAFNLTTTAQGSLVHAAETMRNRTHSPGPAYIERREVSAGVAGGIASAAIEDRAVAAPGTVAVEGTFSGAADWAGIAVEVRSSAPLPTTTTSTTTSTTTTTTTSTTESTTTTTLVPSLCFANPLPAEGCRAIPPGDSSVSIEGAPRPGLIWRWQRGDGTLPGSFGNPMAGDQEHRVCVYDASSATPLRLGLALSNGSACAGVPCWRALRTGGYRYRDTVGLPHGVRAIKLRAHGDGRAKIKTRARGENLPLASLPANGFVPPVIVQFVIESAGSVECWQSSFTAAEENTSEHFSAKAP